MKTRSTRSFHGEPSKTTRRKELTEQNSANKAFAGPIPAATATSTNLVPHFNFKSHYAASASADLLEAEEKMLMSMEDAAGIAVWRLAGGAFSD